jgi:hypothetical protein
MGDGFHVPHIPHPHIELRKELFQRQREWEQRFNNSLAVKITGIVGTMWCAYLFAGLALISLPQALREGTGPTIDWFAQTFLQLVLLSIIMVGQRVQSAKSDAQLEQTYNDAEALLHMSDDMHRLIKQNVRLTEQIEQVLRHNVKFTEQIEKLLKKQPPADRPG